MRYFYLPYFDVFNSCFFTKYPSTPLFSIVLTLSLINISLTNCIKDTKSLCIFNDCIFEQSWKQLERLRSEDTPRRLMITHIIESYWIPSQKKTKSKLQI